MKKKLLFREFILLICILMVFTNLTYAESIDINHKLSALDSIGIFKGNGNGYDLDSKLKRSEAATLIVRLIGESDMVLNNKSSYVNTPLSDVKSEDWFAPYVGYCYKNDIIKGFPDGTFKPNDYITEKAFTQLVLGALGYKSGEDFNWDNIFRLAVDKGLNENLEYVFKSDDNNMYYRRDAVSLLYNSLDKMNKITTNTLVNNLISKGMTDRLTAERYGLIKKDLILTDIKNIDVLNYRNIKVEFNESVNIDDSDIKIINNNESIKISKVSHFQDYLEIQTSEELSDLKEYEMIINKAYDLDGNTVNNIKKTFSGYKNVGLESPYFLISKVELIEKDLLEVYFTQPIDESAEQVLLYEFYKNGTLFLEGNFKTLRVQKIKDKNAVAIRLLSNEITDGDEFKVIIKGDLKSEYGAYLNKGNGHEQSFLGSSSYLEKLSIVSAEFYDKDLVRLIFNRDVDIESALDTKNYSLSNDKNGLSINPSKVYFSKYESENNDVIMLKFSNTKSDISYTLKVDGVYGIYMEDKISSYTSDLGLGMIDNYNIEIVNINAIDRSTLEVSFDKMLSDSSRVSNVFIDNGIYIKSKEIKESDPYTMVIGISKVRYLESDKVYNIKFNSGLTDVFGRLQKHLLTADFVGNEKVKEDTIIENAIFISGNLVKVDFSSEVRESDLTDINKYEFEYSDGIVKKTLFPSSIKKADSSSLILGFDYELLNGEIEVIAKDIYDVNGEIKYSILKRTVLK